MPRVPVSKRARAAVGTRVKKASASRSRKSRTTTKSSTEKDEDAVLDKGRKSSAEEAGRQRVSREGRGRTSRLTEMRTLRSQAAAGSCHQRPSDSPEAVRQAYEGRRTARSATEKDDDVVLDEGRESSAEEAGRQKVSRKGIGTVRLRYQRCGHVDVRLPPEAV